jgi:hypothetical protein
MRYPPTHLLSILSPKFSANVGLGFGKYTGAAAVVLFGTPRSHPVANRQVSDTLSMMRLTKSDTLRITAARVAI